MATIDSTTSHQVVSQAEWLRAREKLFLEEKELTRRYDELRQKRMDLPWVKIEKPYLFTGLDGKKTLVDLFNGRSQLLVYHFMFAPEWEEGCPGCSYLADHVDGALVHLNNHDVTFCAISRAPYDKLLAYKQRMGWKFPWVSAAGSDFNFDFHVSFRPEEIATGKVYYNYALRDFMCEDLQGLSAFYKNDAGEVFHTYSNYSRGGEMLATTFAYLDCAPLGRNENGDRRDLGDWVRRKYEYPTPGDGVSPGAPPMRSSLPLGNAPCCQGKKDG